MSNCKISENLGALCVSFIFKVTGQSPFRVSQITLPSRQIMLSDIFASPGPAAAFIPFRDSLLGRTSHIFMAYALTRQTRISRQVTREEE
jgi:hypothetical protein